MQPLKTIITNIIQIVVYAGIVQGLYSAFILSQTHRRNPANNFLSALLIILIFSIIHSVFIIPYFNTFRHTNFHIKEPFIFLVMPFIWLYVKKLNEPLLKFKIKHLFHLTPFILIMLICFIFLINPEKSINIKFINHTLIGNVFVYVIALIQYTFYLIYILKLIRSIKSKVLSEYSNTENIDPAWLRVFLLTILVVFVMSFFMMVIAIHNLNVNYFNNLISLVFAIVIFIFGYKGLNQRSITSDDQLTSVVTETIIEEIKVDEILLKKLLEFMVMQKPFQDTELTLTGLAKQMNISRNQLSELINSGTGGNFYDFVNKYRVEEVKELFQNPKFKDFTILAIAYEAGFPSKSTFNSIFKKFTGFTPSEYRNRLS